MNDQDKKHLIFLLSMTKEELHEFFKSCPPETLIYSLNVLSVHYNDWFAEPTIKIKQKQKEDYSLAKEYLKKFMLNKT